MNCVVVKWNLDFNLLLSNLLRRILNNNCELIVFCIRGPKNFVIFLEVEVISQIKYLNSVLLIKLTNEELGVCVLNGFIAVDGFIVEVYGD